MKNTPLDPAAHDQKLAALTVEYYALRSNYRSTLELGSKVKPERSERPNVWRDRALAVIREDNTYKSHFRNKLADLTRQIKPLAKEVKQLESQYTGWSRFFLVAGGHIHSSTRCSTCNHNWVKPTRFSWLPELSGLTEEDAVKAHGPLLCTTCFPTAPLDWTKGVEDTNTCPGSGTDKWIKTEKLPRFGYVSGNGGNCSHCKNWVAPKSGENLVMRKHKK